MFFLSQGRRRGGIRGGMGFLIGDIGGEYRDSELSGEG